tara:strand:- start:973 stop:1341 length:369 start_codon:yes stop_codon:yes gene_type:complete
MSNGKAHILTGCTVGLAIVCIDRGNMSEITHNPITASVVGAVFAKLPDILEPALHSHHRQFFHSVVFLSAVSYSLMRAYEWKPKDAFEKALRGFALIAAGGYLSHLLLDMTTPRGIPILGKI